MRDIGTTYLPGESGNESKEKNVLSSFLDENFCQTVAKSVFRKRKIMSNLILPELKKIVLNYSLY